MKIIICLRSQRPSIKWLYESDFGQENRNDCRYFEEEKQYGELDYNFGRSGGLNRKGGGGDIRPQSSWTAGGCSHCSWVQTQFVAATRGHTAVYPLQMLTVFWSSPTQSLLLVQKPALTRPQCLLWLLFPPRANCASLLALITEPRLLVVPKPEPGWQESAGSVVSSSSPDETRESVKSTTCGSELLVE